MRLYRRTQFGNPILRTSSKALTRQEIVSKQIQELLRDMRYTLEKRQYGVGLAAPQIGKGVMVAVVGLKPSPTRPNIEKVDMDLINPVITKYYGKTTGMWEACISGSELYGKAARYEKIRLVWQDKKAQRHEKDFDGLLAQVIQHEVDHLNGVLFVDRVKDPKTYVTFSEYKKIRKAENKRKR
jgi:peptide deformylase